MIRLWQLRTMFVAAFGTLASCCLASPPARRPASVVKPISFVNQVIPALTRVGCNQGTCHGAAAGKNGFKLSLRGFAPELDYVAIVRQAHGRRVNVVQPAQSLLLRKPLLELPHRGGRVLRRGTQEYEILTRWLAQGAPGPDPRDPHVTALQVMSGSFSSPYRAIKIAATRARSLPAETENSVSVGRLRAFVAAASAARGTLTPGARLQLHVLARFSDGSTRDVTHWARFATNDENTATVVPDGLVTVTGVGQTSIMVGYQDRVAVACVMVPFPNKIDVQALARQPRASDIDVAVYSKLAALRLSPSRPATDLEFIRRVTIDLIGTLPTPAEARTFAASRSPNKREALVDSLMARPEFIDFWAYKWSDLLRVNRGMLKDKGMWAYYSYIHDAVRDNKPWNMMAREILTARGNTFLDGPANYFRTALKPEELAENVSQGFLGIRVQCAKCHNHPLEHWTQNEYYGMANLFARVKFKADLSIYANDEMTVYNAASGDLIQPRLGRPIPPKPLGGPMLALDAPRERRDFFVEWLTRPDNWYFSHAIVNRVWAHFMGRGLVEPVDDLRETNPATNPELFDALANDFVKHGFDLRRLMRRIVTSKVYQLSSVTTPQNSRDDRYYSHYLVRRMAAEELLDALSQVTGKPETFPGIPPGYRAIQLPDTHVKSDFMDILGRPPRQITCECERSQEPNMAQALFFINGELVNRKVTADGGLVDELVRAGKSDAEILDALYWAAFGRPPRPAERTSNLATLHRVLAAPSVTPTVTPAAASQAQGPVIGASGKGNAAAAASQVQKAEAKAENDTTRRSGSFGFPRAVETAATKARSRPAPTKFSVSGGTLRVFVAANSFAGHRELNDAARRQAFEDMLWALVNSKEFLFNH